MPCRTTRTCGLYVHLDVVAFHDYWKHLLAACAPAQCERFGRESNVLDQLARPDVVLRAMPRADDVCRTQTAPSSGLRPCESRQHPWRRACRRSSRQGASCPLLPRQSSCPWLYHPASQRSRVPCLASCDFRNGASGRYGRLLRLGRQRRSCSPGRSAGGTERTDRHDGGIRRIFILE